MKNFFFQKNKKKGISLLLTIIIMAIILSLGLGLSAILIRGTRIIKFNEDTIITFYAADAGAEEALKIKSALADPCSLPAKIPLQYFPPPYDKISYEVFHYSASDNQCFTGGNICSCFQSYGYYHEKTRSVENSFESSSP